MEHRWNARRLVAGDVVIECPRGEKVRATMRDMSLGGMCVEAPATALPLNAPVMVGFRLPTRERDGGYHLRAMIVRHAGGAAGLMFLDLGTGTVESLRNDLRALKR